MAPPATFMDAYRPCLRGSRHMTVAGHYLAAQAGFRIMEAGGNAIDAGVAAGLVLGVVQSDLVNFAGVAPIILYLAETDEVLTISGLGVWPQATDAAWMAAEHPGGVPRGVRRQIVPAAPDAWLTALARYGRLSFAEVAEAAISLARDGFVMYPLMAEVIAGHASDYGEFPSNAAIYLPGGRPPDVGKPFVQSDLAGTIQYMADCEAAAGGGRADGIRAARDAFYKGDIAGSIADFHAAQGGWLRREDLAAFSVGIEPALSTQFNGIEILGCGPWCQGPVLLQALALLDGRDLAALGHNSPDYVHVMTEAFKLAVADRERWYGDPRFVDVPMERLLSSDYNAARRALIDMQRASPGMPPAGDPGMAAPAAKREPVAALDTSYVCCVDADGNVFSATPSDGSYDGPVVPGTGIVPSTRGSQSRPDPAHPSSVAPGKRPRLTPNPALARRRGEWVMPLGTPGGDVQCQAMMQALINVTAFGMNPQEAVEAPRFASYSFPNSFAPHSYFPGLLKLEGRIDPDTGAALEARGHDIEWWGDWHWHAGAMCLIQADLRDGVMAAGADPRRACYAAGW